MPMQRTPATTVLWLKHQKKDEAPHMWEKQKQPKGEKKKCQKEEERKQTSSTQDITPNSDVRIEAAMLAVKGLRVC